MIKYWDHRDKHGRLQAETIMDQADLALLNEQFNDYFIVEQQINLNVKPFDHSLPDEASFEALIPAPFKMVSELAALDQSALKSLNRISEFADELASYLRAQARKIDMMMGFLLAQQDDQQYRQRSQSFGGSALCFYQSQPYAVGTLLEVKMFLEHGEGAVFCLVTVLESIPQDDKYLIRTTYRCLREIDRELIVRASLHEQSRQLKRKAELRMQQGNR
jgi:hypothetical protein